MSKYPDAVTHEELLEAIRPLLDLCNTNQDELWFGFHLVDGGPTDPDNLTAAGRIEFVTAVDPEDGTEPITVGEGEFAAQGWPVSVAVYF